MTITTIDITGNAAHLPFFYRLIESAMISKQIKGSLDKASFKTLLVKKKYFTWTEPVTGAQEFNRPTILQLIVNSINPKNCVGVSN